MAIKFNFFKFNNQSKILLAGLVLGSALIFILAFSAIGDIQNKSDKIYSDFAQILSKSIASQTALQLASAKDEFPRDYYNELLQNNNDLSFIEYKDKNNNVIYSAKTSSEDDNTVFTVTSPVIVNNKIEGNINIGLTGQGNKSVCASAKKSLTGIFIITWLTFLVLLLLSYIFISKDLKNIYKGVKQISTGKFGVKLESENMGELVSAFNDMSNLLSRYEKQNIEQITLERNKLEAVLMSIINGVIVCDNLDNVVLANSAALSMLDIEERNFINTKIQNYTDSHGQRCFLEKIEEFKDTPLNIIEIKPVEFNIEAEKKTIKAMISPMFSKQQDYVGYIIVLIDITREAEVNKLKNTFISNVSHELRTPVTVLRTYIDTLCHNGDDFDEETKKEFMTTLDTEAKRLHTMVNDILDFSRLESGNICLRKEFTDIVELLEQNINSIKILADEKNIKIDFIKPQSLPKVPVNIESIDRVIRNLLSNAIKYSPDDKEITVSAGLSDDGNFVKFSVKDNGIGIAKEHLDKVFDRFYRVENATHIVKGTGLGLHLVKLTVEKYHNGKITLQSKVNEGSTFTVFLPLTAAEEDLV